ncbi:MAG: DUF488 domain-containing protein, partial [Aeoliella sp.]
MIAEFARDLDVRTEASKVWRDGITVGILYAMPTILVKRVYDPPTTGDGRRILVDRLWPRGLSKENAKVDMWVK